MYGIQSEVALMIEIQNPKARTVTYKKTHFPQMHTKMQSTFPVWQ
jgi:hypothetical protein